MRIVFLWINCINVNNWEWYARRIRYRSGPPERYSSWRSRKQRAAWSRPCLDYSDLYSRIYEILSCIYEILSNAFEILSHIYEIHSCIYEILSNTFEILSHTYEIQRCVYEKQSYTYEILSCTYEIMSCTHEMMSRTRERHIVVNMTCWVVFTRYWVIHKDTKSYIWDT